MERLDVCNAGEQGQGHHYHRHRDQGFYVTVIEGQRVGYLLGPYASHQQAIDNVERGRTLAVEADTWADFYSFGVASRPTDSLKRTVFGS